MLNRFLPVAVSLAVVAMSVVAMSLAVVAISGSSQPVAMLGMRPILAQSPQGIVEMMPNQMERKGPEFMSMAPQMQMLTCFGHCGAECKKYCTDNYMACTQNNLAERQKYHYAGPNDLIDPATSQPNWCRATLDRCEGHCS